MPPVTKKECPDPRLNLAEQAAALAARDVVAVPLPIMFQDRCRRHHCPCPCSPDMSQNGQRVKKKTAAVQKRVIFDRVTNHVLKTHVFRP